jgi:hypothetical protein
MEKLQYNQVKKELNFRISNPVCDYDTIELLKTNIDFDVYLPSIGKNLQRGYVWDLLQKQQFILSILKEQKISPICVVKTVDDKGERLIRIIDGKQRISTMLSFVKNEFPIEYDEKSYYFDDCDIKIQRKLMSFYFEAYTAYEYLPDEMISDENLIMWFEQINFLGTPQDIEHLKNLKNK